MKPARALGRGVLAEASRLHNANRAAWRAFRTSFADPISRIAYERTADTIVFEGDFPVEGRYFVSTDSGLFRVERGMVRKISATGAYGVALADNKIYVATIDGAGRRGIVLAGDKSALDRPAQEIQWRTIYSSPIKDPGERIHQISICGDALWLANTANNSYTKIDRHTGRWLAEICPFRCEFGQRIKNDHNHVNSVSAYANHLIFGAWRINMRGCFGVVGDGLIQLYAYENAGIHDCHIAGQSFLFTDSFRFDRAAERGPNGCVVRDGRIVDRNFFDNNDVGCVRGLAGGGAEALAGLSFPGSRENRFSGTGGLLLFQDWSVVRQIALPCAQVYDIIRDDGRSFDQPPAARNFSEAAALLRATFGPPVLERTLEESLMPQNLNVSLNGTAESTISEYLA
jgi:hypothetical protein